MNTVALKPPQELTETVREIPRYSVHLNFIRGCAALVVFFTHLKYIFLGNSMKAAVAVSATHVQELEQKLHAQGGIIDLGHKAVMVFFVLSGYFVGGTVVRAMKRGNWSWKDYLIQRMTRLWVVLAPALLLGLAVDLLGSHLFPQSIYSGPEGQFILTPGLAERLSPATFFGNLFFLQTIFVKPLGTNVALWSLANEFWYYLAFPLMALMIVRRSVYLRLSLALAFAATLLLMGGKIAPYYVLWLFGLVAAFLPLRLPEKIQRPAAVLSFLGLAVACLLLKYTEANRFSIDLAVSSIFLLLLYSLLHRTRPNNDGLYSAVAELLAKMSYSLYLVHLPLIFFANALLMRHWNRWPYSPISLLMVSGVALTIFLLAYVFHLSFEARTPQVRQWVGEKLSS